MHAPSGRRNWLLASWIFAPMGIFGVLLCGANDRRKFQTYIAASMIVMILFLAGCSGTSAGAPLEHNRTGHIQPQCSRHLWNPAAAYATHTDRELDG